MTGTGGLADGKITASDAARRRRATSRSATTKFYEWNRRGLGPCDIYCGFGHSSDTFFYQVAGMLGIDRLGYWAKQYGFGAPTGIDLPGEVSGIVPTNEWKQDALGRRIFPGETYQAGIGQGYDAVTPIQLINAYAALANGGTLYQPQIVREIVGPDGDGRPAVRARRSSTRWTSSRACSRMMRNAARATVTLRHTYNLVDLPIKVAGKSGTAEFGVRDRKGRLPFHSWFVGFTPEGSDRRLVRRDRLRARRPGLRLRLADHGNAATEIVKYFFQLHYDIKKDYRISELLERGNFYQQTTTDGRHPSRTRARHRLGRQVRRGGLARVRPAARHATPALLVAVGLVMAYTNSVESGSSPARGRHDVHPRADVGRHRDRRVHRRDRVRLPLAEDAGLADLRPPARPARADAGDRRRRRRVGALGHRSGRSRSSSASSPRS